MKTLPLESEQKEYVQKILKTYIQLPETPTRPRSQDRRLALQLYQRAIPLPVVEAALILATVRRLGRAPDAPPLSPIRSLHYFIPIVEEILAHPLPQGYVEYLRSKISRPASVQKTAFAHHR